MKDDDLKNIDIVYFVKESSDNEELRYSLRSVEKNFPHRKVWIYGGCPNGIMPDRLIKISQTGNTKWDKVRNMFRQVCLNNEISEDFVLFNDDFFVMKPLKNLEVMFRCPLYEHIVKLEMKFQNKPNEYSTELRKATKALGDLGMTVNSYELHVPMLFNRHKLLEILGAFPGLHCTRTLYGNFHEIGGKQHDDVKVFEVGQSFDRDSIFLSTEDSTFPGEVGEFIRSKFKERSRFEG